MWELFPNNKGSGGGSVGRFAWDSEDKEGGGGGGGNPNGKGGNYCNALFVYCNLLLLVKVDIESLGFYLSESVVGRWTCFVSSFSVSIFFPASFNSKSFFALLNPYLFPIGTSFLISSWGAVPMFFYLNFSWSSFKADCIIL